MINKILIGLIVFCGVGLIPAGFAAAEDPAALVVDFQENPLFDDITNFLPGNTEVRWADITNNSGQEKKIGIKVVNQYTDIKDYYLSDRLNLVISEGGNELWSGSLTTYYETGEIYTSDLGNQSTVRYDFSITFITDAGNDYQSSVAEFKIEIGFFGEESVSSEIQPGGGGSGTGGNIAAGLRISNELASDVGGYSVTITWLTTSKSTSRVIYSPEGFSHSFDYNNPPNYGYAFSTIEDSDKDTFHTVTITGLTPNTIYYYRTISHASPATISLERSFTTLAAGEIEEGIDWLSEEKPEEIALEQEIVPLAGTSETGTPATPSEEMDEEELDEKVKEDEKEKVGEDEDAQSDFDSSFLAGIAGLGSNFGGWLIVLGIVLLILCVLIVIRKKKRR